MALSAFTPRRYMVSHLGCLHACADFLRINVESAWICGITGYAFMLNVPRGVSVRNW